MTVRGFVAACRRTVEHGHVGGVPNTAVGTTGGDAQHGGDLFDVRLDELRTMPEATLPVAFER